MLSTFVVMFFSGRIPNCTYTSISRINYRRWRQVGKRWGIMKKLLPLLCCAFRLQPLLNLGVDAQNISHGNSGIWNAFLPSNEKKITSIAAFWHLHWSLRSNFSTRCCFTACACYFLTNFYLSPNDSPLKTVTDVFYFI